MSNFIPDYVLPSIFDITPAMLQAEGVRGILIDLDGTMVSHVVKEPDEKIRTFARQLKAENIQILVFSNNKEERVSLFCKTLGVPFISRARKPFAKSYAKASEMLGIPMKELAVVGDQIYTDVFGGNRQGALSIYIDTLDRHFFWINLRYQFERGFIRRGRKNTEAKLKK